MRTGQTRGTRRGQIRPLSDAAFRPDFLTFCEAEHFQKKPLPAYDGAQIAMADIEVLLKRWQTAGAIDAETAARIRACETGSAENDRAAAPSGIAAAGGTPAGLRWLVVTGLIMGAILLACGVALFVSAHWDELSPAGRFALALAMVAVFHLAGGLTRAGFEGLATALHAVGTIATGAAIALVGQIFNIQEHWPAAVLLWALAALAGWVLLRDQAQQTLALLLLPAWISSELSYRMQGDIGVGVYLGRLGFVWAMLYLTFFARSRRKVVRGVLFAVSVIGVTAGSAAMIANWVSWTSAQSFIPFGTRVWAWLAIAAAPLLVAAFHGHRGLIPIAVSLLYATALPWCYHSVTQTYLLSGGGSGSYVLEQPNLAAHLLVAGFAVFLCWWGVRQVSRALVNLGIVGFAGAVGWFYFSDIFNKLDRSLGLIGLGVLFLAGGWALEKMRRRILAGMGAPEEPAAVRMEGGR